MTQTRFQQTGLFGLIVLLAASLASADWLAVQRHVPASSSLVVSIPNAGEFSRQLGDLSRAGHLQNPLLEDLKGTLPGVLGLGAGVNWSAPLAVAIENPFPAPPAPPLPGQPAAAAPPAPQTLAVLSIQDAGAFRSNFGLPADSGPGPHRIVWLGEEAHLIFTGDLALLATHSDLLNRAQAAGVLLRALPPAPAPHEALLRINTESMRPALRSRLNTTMPDTARVLNQFLHPDAQTAAHRSTEFWGQWLFQGMDRLIHENGQCELRLGIKDLQLSMNLAFDLLPDSAWNRHLQGRPEARLIAATAPDPVILQMTFDRDLMNLNRGLLDEVRTLHAADPARAAGYQAAIERFFESIGPASLLLMQPGAADAAPWQQKRLWIFEKKSPDALERAFALLDQQAASQPAPDRRFKLERRKPADAAALLHPYELKLVDGTAAASESPFLQAFWREHAGGLFEAGNWLMWMENATATDGEQMLRHFRDHPPQLKTDASVFFRAELHPGQLAPVIGPFLLMAAPDARPPEWDQARHPATLELRKTGQKLIVEMNLKEPPASAVLEVLWSVLLATE